MKGKTFAPKVMIMRILEELEPGYSAFFIPGEKEKRGAKNYNT